MVAWAVLSLLHPPAAVLDALPCLPAASIQLRDPSVALNPGHAGDSGDREDGRKSMGCYGLN